MAAMNLGRRGAAAVDEDATPQLINRGRIGHTSDDDFVLLLDFVSRMRELRGKFAVSGQ